MDQKENNRPANNNMHSRLCSPYVNVVLVAFLAIAAFYLIAEHQAHLYGYSVWIFPIVFIALHFWMHAGHRHGHGSRRSREQSSDTQQPPDLHQH